MGSRGIGCKSEFNSLLTNEESDCIKKADDPEVILAKILYINFQKYFRTILKVKRENVIN